MNGLRIHCFQHVPYEGLGCIKDWALHEGHTITYTRFFEDWDIPDIDNIDWLIVVGGPMGYHDDNKYPWLIDEKIFIDQAIKADKIVIGICLGAQLIAGVLGAKVYPNLEKEIGYLPIKITNEAEKDQIFKLFPPEIDVLHWHNDTFDLPEGAKPLAFSEATKNQAFIYNNKVLAMQFHIEMQKVNIIDLIDNNPLDLTRSKYVQSQSEIKHNLYMTFESNVFMKCVLERLEKYA